jgi:chromosomal replication initiator protein
MRVSTEPLRAENEVLREILASLQERIGPQKFNAWFRHGTKLQLGDDRITVAVPNPFVANWIEQHYHGDLTETIQDHLGTKLPVTVAIDPELSSQCRKRNLDMQAEIVSRSTQGRSRNLPAVPICSLKHRLEDFVVGASNRLAYQSAMAVSQSRNGHFGQLFVHGPCGVGKTHLLQGICNLAAARSNGDGRLNWRYVTGEQFTNEFIAALRSKTTRQFRDRYRKLDLLAIDDVHFLAAKRATQDEFLHTFNAIESAGKQIILASDAHPRLVGELHEQLVSRFLSGMVVKIEPPDKQTRMEILFRRANRIGLDLPQDVADYIADHIRASVRELEGTLVKLSALAALEDGRVSLRIARDALSDHLARTDSVITLGDIEAVVAAYFGITPADIHSSRRTRTVSVARMVAMTLARRHTQMSFPEIGRYMGKNHSSVVLATQRMQRLLDDGDELVWNTPAGTRRMDAGELLTLLEEQFA